MPISQSDVLDVARLARVRVDEQELSRIAGDLSDILQLVERMNAVDTEGVVPMAHPLDMSQPLRADDITEEERRDEWQSLSPSTQDGLYLVPKVIE
ncbi:MAG: Asp-tRNA(Asn)/Glu-tRNA(Gln) amidotransferase subunit GatC [Ectothiorhodospiraceae bacterium AqS1]|nr:Asp-tRNA(Asn)/Glu-tRNA(Gln) amidotransferase subunit GatC [Ectothiorhodospiraceae bacterium AqS1]MBF2759659.1 Asp-tRNA(Asn)/Glu-tRNA(Gln) amidotransferase subunit GatC [Ectothiorhodospiraceae bacterium AqS1]